MRLGASVIEYDGFLVSGAAVITKIISMSADLDDDAMEDQVQLEAANYIPFPIDEAQVEARLSTAYGIFEGQADRSARLRFTPRLSRLGVAS